MNQQSRFHVKRLPHNIGRSIVRVARVTLLLPRFFLLIPIKAYQKVVSPFISPRCKYYPSCSSYGYVAIRRHGVIIGTVLGVWRLVRCNPWSLGGIDEVPEESPVKRLLRRDSASIV